jgi:hypothetical protein
MLAEKLETFLAPDDRREDEPAQSDGGQAQVREAA